MESGDCHRCAGGMVPRVRSQGRSEPAYNPANRRLFAMLGILRGALLKFVETPLKGAYLVEPEFIEDERGYFARTFCRREFADINLNPDIAQCSISYNKSIGTLRGL